MEKIGNYYKFDKCDLVLEKGTKIARYWVNCYDRELVLLLNDYNLTNKDIGEIEMQLDKAYIDWCDSKNPEVYEQCCEEYMVDNLDKYYKNCIIAVIYENDYKKGLNRTREENLEHLVATLKYYDCKGLADYEPFSKKVLEFLKMNW